MSCVPLRVGEEADFVRLRSSSRRLVGAASEALPRKALSSRRFHWALRAKSGHACPASSRCFSLSWTVESVMRDKTFLGFLVFSAFFAACGGDDTTGAPGVGGGQSTGGAAGDVGSGGSAGSSGSVGSGGATGGSAGSGTGGSSAGQGGSSGSGGASVVDSGASGAGGMRDASSDSSTAGPCSGRMCGDLCTNCPASQPLCPGAAGHCTKQGVCEILLQVTCD
jgi:hypothetical protein